MAVKIVEDEIIARISTAITDLKVEGFPENSSTYELIHSKGAVLVSYNSSSFSEPTGFDVFQQIEDMNFDITLVVKGLRDKFGAYTYIDTLKSILSGFVPTDCSLCYIKSVSFISEEQGEWQYAISCVVTKENYI